MWHSAGENKLKVKRLKVYLVVQGQHMSKDKGDFKDVFSPVPHFAGVRCYGIALPLELHVPPEKTCVQLYVQTWLAR
jgi:hypothetical protein